MLRQTVKTFLRKQNRLSFSSLQITIRKIQILNILEPQLKNKNEGRVLSHHLCCKNFHATGIQSCSANNLSLKGCNKHLNKQNNRCMDKIALNENDNYADHEAQSQMFNPENEIESSDIENIDENDSHDVEDSSDELFLSEDRTSRNFLMPLQSRDLQTTRSNQESSLIHSEDIYQPKSIIQTILDEEMEAGDKISPDFAALEEKYDLEQAEKGILKTEGVQKVEFPALQSIAPIVNDSEILKRMVDLGVSLYYVQKKGMIDHFLQMNFKKDVSPYIFFLKDTGVPVEKFGRVITECPWIFQHDVHNLKVRVDYLRSKKFSKTDIVNMIDSDPLFLLIPMKRIDAKLGYLQKEFRLTGAEVRKTVSSYPKLVIAKPAVIQEKKFYMKKFLGFKEHELKTLLLSFPEAYIRSSERTALIFDYLHNVMELSHELIVRSGESLGTSRYILESRHRYLVKQGRAQYDPTLPNYVSLKSLIVPKDEDFCSETAKTSISEYNTFLRLI